MRSLTGKLHEASTARRLGIPLYKACARAIAFLPPPRVVANSLPKSGTHLLMTLLSGLPRMMFSGVGLALTDFMAPDSSTASPTPDDIDWARLRRVLDSVRNGQYVRSHLPAEPKVAELLEDLGYAHIFMVRDPRDIVVSHALYIESSERHFLHERYMHDFKTTPDRILASITGFPQGRSDPGLESIGRKLDRYLPWGQSSRVLTCRFEDLVGPKGGGTLEEQHRAIAHISQHIKRPLTPQRIEQLAVRAWSPQSSTFRRGVSGDWRRHFKDEHVDAFKEIAGGRLIELGYESDLNWSI